MREELRLLRRDLETLNRMKPEDALEWLRAEQYTRSMLALVAIIERELDGFEARHICPRESAEL